MRDEILEMSGTPEDVDKVAELMGWHHWVDPLGKLPDGKWWLKEGSAYRQAEANWNPFKSWSDVGMVLERLNEQDIRVFLISLKGLANCTLGKGSNPVIIVGDGNADNAPTAICRAALQAVKDE